MCTFLYCYPPPDTSILPYITTTHYSHNMAAQEQSQRITLYNIIFNGYIIFYHQMISWFVHSFSLLWGMQIISYSCFCKLLSLKLSHDNEVVQCLEFGIKRSELNWLVCYIVAVWLLINLCAFTHLAITQLELHQLISLTAEIIVTQHIIAK